MVQSKNKSTSTAEPSKKGSELKIALDRDKTTSDKVAILITDLLGSLTFLLIFFTAIIIYILWNLNLLPVLKPFDKYPFDALDTILSIFAVTLSISVLISQNRQRRIEKISEDIEFEVNVRAETEITKVLAMLHDIQQKLGIHKDDKELEEMKENLDLHQLHANAGDSKELK